MKRKILITGSSGLVGTALTAALLAKGNEVIKFDLREQGASRGDVLDYASVNNIVSGIDGIVHLAAVSRVVWGELNPELCWATNVGGLRNVISAATQSPRKPWLVFASSREVYGQPIALPATEDVQLSPVNIYGRSKVAGELLVAEARSAGFRACTIRLSNVFGTTADHADRVVPAFARAAALGEELRVDGLNHTFDFTHIDDVTRGIVTLIKLLETGEALPPPIHFVSGRPTTLGELASLAVRLGHPGASIRTAAPRNFDVARFYGDPLRAKTLLDWQPLVQLEDGVARLIKAFRNVHQANDADKLSR
ncbi:NAD-dependent epimerase/dehydratase family protein [Hydrogenophaga sp. R2]|uniref:NAD-dependent epimerase/dehydratase family protein n=1 Tax=Hydrogenophaga sp. R2 TaxID=3132827 RepID=UPI003CF1D658